MKNEKGFYSLLDLMVRRNYSLVPDSISIYSDETFCDFTVAWPEGGMTQNGGGVMAVQSGTDEREFGVFVDTVRHETRAKRCLAALRRVMFVVKLIRLQRHLHLQSAHNMFYYNIGTILFIRYFF